MNAPVKQSTATKLAASEKAQCARLAAQRVLEPKKWEAQIRAAMKAARGDVPAAALALYVTGRTLYRWIAAEDALADLRVAVPAWHHTAKKTASK